MREGATGEIVDLDEADAGSGIRRAHEGGVGAGRERGENHRVGAADGEGEGTGAGGGVGDFGGVASGVPAGVGREEHAVGAEFEAGRCERGRDSEAAEGGTDGAEEDGFRFEAGDDKADDGDLVAAAGGGARREIYDTLLGEGGGVVGEAGERRGGARGGGDGGGDAPGFGSEDNDEDLRGGCGDGQTAKGIHGAGAGVHAEGSIR